MKQPQKHQFAAGFTFKKNGFTPVESFAISEGMRGKGGAA